jgi:hypothetical protein
VSVKSQKQKTERERSAFSKILSDNLNSFFSVLLPDLNLEKTQFTITVFVKSQSLNSASDKSRLLSLLSGKVQALKLVRSKKLPDKSQLSKTQFLNEEKWRFKLANLQCEKVS